VASPLAAAAAVAEALRNFLRLEFVGIRLSPVYGLLFATLSASPSLPLDRRQEAQPQDRVHEDRGRRSRISDSEVGSPNSRCSRGRRLFCGRANRLFVDSPLALYFPSSHATTWAIRRSGEGNVETRGCFSSGRGEHVLEPPGDNLVFTGSHHPNGNMKEALAAT